MSDEQQRELQEQLMSCRVMEREATDPLASRLLQEDRRRNLEAALQQPGDQIMQKPGVILGTTWGTAVFGSTGCCQP